MEGLRLFLTRSNLSDVTLYLRIAEVFEMQSSGQLSWYAYLFKTEPMSGTLLDLLKGGGAAGQQSDLAGEEAMERQLPGRAWLRWTQSSGSVATSATNTKVNSSTGDSRCCRCTFTQLGFSGYFMFRHHIKIAENTLANIDRYRDVRHYGLDKYSTQLPKKMGNAWIGTNVPFEINAKK